jgi:hypothetical protein
MGMIVWLQLRDQARHYRQAEEEVAKALREADAMLLETRNPVKDTGIDPRGQK